MLSDAALDRLQTSLGTPDTSGTRYRILRKAGEAEWHRVGSGRHRALAPRGAQVRRRGRGGAGGFSAARIVAGLEHPGIVPVHDAGTLPDGRVFAALKFVDGAPLSAALPTLGGPAERLRIFLRAAEAVAFAHARGVVHRDLKPENVMLGAFGEVLVVDWGVAAVRGDAGSSTFPVSDSGTRDGTVVGTPGWMAPEQERGEISRVDARSDVFALGRLLSVLAEPRPGEPGLDRRLSAIVAKATAQEPETRYENAAALAADVARHLEGEPVSAYREGPVERLARLAVRHRVALLLLLAYLVTRALVLFLQKS
jgi:serine/threonine protein kinase